VSRGRFKRKVFAGKEIDVSKERFTLTW